MSRAGGHSFEEYLIETKGAKTKGILPAGLNNYPASSLGPIGEKKWRISNQCKVTMSWPGGHFFEEFLIETKGGKSIEKWLPGPNSYPAPSLGPIGEKKWRISNRCSHTRLQ